MPELIDRENWEADFAKRFGKVARRHMREFRRLLGEPADIANVPQEFYDRMQRESDDALWPILLLLFGTSAEQHGWIGDLMGLAAYGWAIERADRLSQQWTESTRNRLEKGWEKITKPVERTNPEETVEQAREFNRMSPANRIGGIGVAEAETAEPTKDEIDELIDSAFGPSRVATTAVTETTGARHAGGEAAIEETVGISQDDEWRVQEISEGVPDEKVCPICRSVNRVKRKDWPYRLNAGPPCHPNDRCWVWYANVPLSDAIGRMLDDPDYKSLNSVSRHSFILLWCQENGIELGSSRFKSAIA